MAHVDGMCLRASFTERGQSRFARPVAKVTEFMRTLGDRARAMLARRSAGSGGPPRPHAHQELEVRRLEEFYAGATDVHELERMERDWDRRDGGGIRNWDWR
jgi:hypothetical protein